jgi:hypothetical protein
VREKEIEREREREKEREREGEREREIEREKEDALVRFSQMAKMLHWPPNNSNSHSRKSFSAGPPACLGRRAGDSRAGR